MPLKGAGKGNLSPSFVSDSPMTVFDYLSVALSLVIGLSVARLLSSALRLFKSRGRIVVVDRVTLVWAGLCFGWQLQFWWAIYPFGRLPTWTFGSFLLLVTSAVLLFAASGLVLPGPDEGEFDLARHFRTDGRWGVACLMAYFLSAFPLGPAVLGPEVFFGAEMLPIHVLTLVTVGLGCGVVAARSRRLRVALTTASVAVQAVLYFVSVPWRY